MSLLTLLGLVLLVSLVALLLRERREERLDLEEAERAPFDRDPPHEVPIEDALDLHSFAPRDVPDVVDGYLEAAAEAGFREVRLIHGKGKGVQRRRVQEILSTHPLVEEFFDAPAARGAWGATIARLRLP